VDTVWKGPIVAGDMNAIGGRVHREDFMSTLVRGRRTGNYKAILVLSYVTGLMSGVILEQMGKWVGPVIWVDSHDNCPLPDMKLVSRGVCFRGLKAPQTMVKGEPVTSQRTQMYSENLIKFEVISYLTPKNASVQYWEMMRPFAKALQYKPGGTAPLIIDNLSEAVNYQGITSNSNFYLSSIGRMWEDCTPYLLEEENVFYGRVVYVIHAKHRLAPFIKSSGVHWAEYDGKFFFIWPDVEKQGVIQNGLYHTKYSVKKYSTDRVRKLPIKIVSHWQNALIVNTLTGTFLWRVFSEHCRTLMIEYLSAFASDGWQKTVDQLEVVQSENNVISPIYAKAKARYDELKHLKPDPFRMPWAWCENGRWGRQVWMSPEEWAKVQEISELGNFFQVGYLKVT